MRFEHKRGLRFGANPIHLNYDAIDSGSFVPLKLGAIGDSWCGAWAVESLRSSRIGIAAANRRRTPGAVLFAGVRQRPLSSCSYTTSAMIPTARILAAEETARRVRIVDSSVGRR